MIMGLKLMRCNEVCQCICVCVFMWHIAKREACREMLKSTSNSSCKYFVGRQGAKGLVFIREWLCKLAHLFLVVGAMLLYFHLLATALKLDRELPEMRKRHSGHAEQTCRATFVHVVFPF